MNQSSEDKKRELAVRFANNLRHFRKQKGFTQLDLAAVLNISKRFIIHMEMGDHMPKADLAYLIAKALNITLDDLFKEVE